MKELLVLFLVFLLFFGCIQQSTGQAKQVIENQELDESFNEGDSNSFSEVNWWGLANYVPLLGK